jgi:hypothetical protein
MFHFALSYSFDDSNLWSTPEVDPFGRFNVLLTSEHLDNHLTTALPAGVRVNPLPAEASARRKSGGAETSRWLGGTGMTTATKKSKILFARVSFWKVSFDSAVPVNAKQ